jgi:hypothetical protein
MESACKWTYRCDIATELCPAAIITLVHIARFISKTGQKSVSQRVQDKRSHFRQGQCFTVLLLHVCGSMCPLLVGAGQTQPCVGFPAASHLRSRISLTSSVMYSCRLAAFVFPHLTMKVPLLPLSQLIQSQSMRLFSSGRNPVLIRTVTTSDSRVGPLSQPVRPLQLPVRF